MSVPPLCFRRRSLFSVNAIPPKRDATNSACAPQVPKKAVIKMVAKKAVVFIGKGRCFRASDIRRLWFAVSWVGSQVRAKGRRWQASRAATAHNLTAGWGSWRPDACASARRAVARPCELQFSMEQGVNERYARLD